MKLAPKMEDMPIIGEAAAPEIAMAVPRFRWPSCASHSVVGE